MSTSVSIGSPAKKISSWVRPGVCEVRASALRPVSALIRLDLPTLDRPAKAISTPCGLGNDSIEPAAVAKRHSCANSRRPASRSDDEKSDAALTAFKLGLPPLIVIQREAQSMPVSMYSVSVPVFMQHLNGLSGVLDKAAAWAAARKVNEADLLNMRLSPDMFPLVRQIRAATDHAANAAGRLSGKELLKFANDETTVAQLKDRIAKTIDYLKSVKQSEVDGTEGKEIKITFPNGNVREFTGQSLLLGNALPNFYFHATTAYDIIRQCGVEIGKRDFMGSPPA